jgi:hypothetical protein
MQRVDSPFGTLRVPSGQFQSVADAEYAKLAEMPVIVQSKRIA